MFNKKERIAASVVLVSSLTGCVVPVLDSTPPPAEVTEAAASKSVALIFDRTEASKITNSEARAIVNGQLDQVAALCKEGFGEKMKVGSESYLMGVDTDGSASIWGFCEAEVDGQMVVVVNSFNSENNELDTKINKKMVVFEDNSVGYEDESGRHIILQHRPGDKYDVLDIDGYAIVRWEDAGEGDYNSILTWMLNIGVTPVSGEAPTDTPESIATAVPTDTLVPGPTATPEIVFQIDGSQYLTQADQIPAEEQALWNEASANYQSFFGEEAVKIAYSNMFGGVVALGPEGTIRGYYNKGADMLLGVEAEGWIKAFGGDQLLMVTNDPTKTRYDFLDSYGKPQSSSKAVEELTLMMRARMALALLKKNEAYVPVTPEGITDIQNYRKDSEFLRQNIDTLPDQSLPLGGNIQMNGLDHPVIMVLDKDIEGSDWQIVGDTVIYRMGKIKPDFEGQLVETTSIGLFTNFFTSMDQNVVGSERFGGYVGKIFSNLSYKKNSKIFFRLIFTEK